ncbi:MAG: superoxide dismutase [Kiritimatiellales bacterium]|nr:superoxide dismutase, Ni [Pontiella sp.]NNJ70831.1 superoxide dismutase [Kiritimatiellales bacterium]
MNKTATYLTAGVLFAAAISTTVQAHCQIPCGIYDDQMRIHMMEEHVTTIEKSMKEIAASPNQNQAVRWVLNKETHADELSEIVTYYFLAQRIKPGMDHYEENLKTLHEILVYSMKAKQTADLANVEKLKELIHNLEHTYFGEAHKH